jgi:hypothetical protein
VHITLSSYNCNFVCVADGKSVALSASVMTDDSVFCVNVCQVSAIWLSACSPVKFPTRQSEPARRTMTSALDRPMAGQFTGVYDS